MALLNHHDVIRRRCEAQDLDCGVLVHAHSRRNEACKHRRSVRYAALTLPFACVCHLASIARAAGDADCAWSCRLHQQDFHADACASWRGCLHFLVWLRVLLGTHARALAQQRPLWRSSAAADMCELQPTTSTPSASSDTSHWRQGPCKPTNGPRHKRIAAIPSTAIVASSL